MNLSAIVVDRRQALALSASAAAGGEWLARSAERRPNAKAVIQILMVGGPSQLETFDPKPEAPTTHRGPFRAIATRTPGVRLCEHLPGLARRLDRVALLRSLTHDVAPIHETGLQLVQTGQLAPPGGDAPNLGQVVAKAFPSPSVPGWVVLNGPLGSTGVSLPQGQGGGGGRSNQDAPMFLNAERSTADSGFSLDDSDRGRVEERRELVRRLRETRNRRGESDGDSLLRNCLLASRLVEAGVRVVTVNAFRSVFDAPTWDVHAAGGRLPTTFDHYRDAILPSFDRAMSALLDDLFDSGALDRCMVMAVGEMGRTPWLNDRGGRDHWPRCFSGLLAGGGVSGGQVIGRSDSVGGEPRDQPIPVGALFETALAALGLRDPSTAAVKLPLS